MHPIALILLTTLCLSTGLSVSAQTIATDRSRQQLFVYEVKLIEEFIERFNDDTASFIRREYSRRQKPFPLSRLQLLMSLFNAENNGWKDHPHLGAFLHEVINPARPLLLSFSDTNWYAEAVCVFQSGRRQLKLPLLLQLHTGAGGRSRWLIAGIGSGLPLQDAGPDAPEARQAIPADPDPLSPTSYATNFLDFYRIFSGQMDAATYLEPALQQQAAALHWVQDIRRQRLRFLYVTQLRFHFFQLPNWFFTVEQFHRKSPNSGWLINRLEKLDPSEKEALKNRLLSRI